MPSKLIDIASAFWSVLAEMAPWLVFGFLAAGVLSVWFKPAWIERHLGGRGFWPVFKASALGVPLPLCSCGVIPVSASLRQHGASKGSTASFLLSTPETGVDSMLATYALMGPLYAVARPVVALVNGVLAGIWIDRLIGEEETGRPDTENSTPERDGDPAHDAVCAETQEDAGASSCCGASKKPGPSTTGGKLVEALRYGLITLPADLVYSLLVGLLLAALLTSLVSEAALATWLGHPWLGLLAAAVVGTPIYVCSTGSIPIAVALLHLGASPGAALVFLIAGPATNAATIAVVGGLLGRRALAVYLGSMVLVALAAGYGLNALVPVTGTMLPEVAEGLHTHGLTGWDHGWAVVMVALLAVGLARRRGWWPGDGGTLPVSDDGNVAELAVEGMTCGHCASTVERALREVPGVRNVAVDLSGKRATVVGEVEAGALAAAVRGAGFRVPDA